MKNKLRPSALLMLCVSICMGSVILLGCSDNPQGAKSENLVPFDSAARALILTETKKIEPLKGLSEKNAFDKAISENLAYLYISYLDHFPNSQNSGEAEMRLKLFRIFSSPADQRIFFSLKHLEETYNLNIDTASCGVCNWGKGLNHIRFDEYGQQVFDGPLLLANLQFISGGWTWRSEDGEKGVYLLRNTKFVYPAIKPTLVLADKDLPQRVLLKVNQAIENNNTSVVPDLSGDAALAVHLMKAFGYKTGDKFTKDNLYVLLKAKEFTERCRSEKWVDENMKIKKRKSVMEAFTTSFSREDLATFDKI